MFVNIFCIGLTFVSLFTLSQSAAFPTASEIIKSGSSQFNNLTNGNNSLPGEELHHVSSPDTQIEFHKVQDFDISSGDEKDLDLELNPSSSLTTDKIQDFLGNLQEIASEGLLATSSVPFVTVLPGLSQFHNIDMNTPLDDKHLVSSTQLPNVVISSVPNTESKTTEPESMQNEDNVIKPASDSLLSHEERTELTAENATNLPEAENSILKELSTRASEVLDSTIDVVKEIILFLNESSDLTEESETDTAHSIVNFDINRPTTDLTFSVDPETNSAHLSTADVHRSEQVKVETEVNGTDIASEHETSTDHKIISDVRDLDGEQSTSILPGTDIPEGTKHSEISHNHDGSEVQNVVDGGISGLDNSVPDASESLQDVTNKNTSNPGDSLQPTSTEASATTNENCPAPGICLLWFMAQDTCALDSHCLGSRICCKIRCSKTCIDV